MTVPTPIVALGRHRSADYKTVFVFVSYFASSPGEAPQCRLPNRLLCGHSVPVHVTGISQWSERSDAGQQRPGRPKERRG
jgi:hypothetical protein